MAKACKKEMHKKEMHHEKEHGKHGHMAKAAMKHHTKKKAK